MTGNGFYIPPIKMVLTGEWFIIVLPTFLDISVRDLCVFRSRLWIL